MVSLKMFVACALLSGVECGRWKEPSDWEEAVAHRRRRNDVRYFPQDSESGFYQPYNGLEYPEFIQDYVAEHMYSAGQPGLSPSQKIPIAPPPAYQKEYSLYPYQHPEDYVSNLGLAATQFPNQVK